MKKHLLFSTLLLVASGAMADPIDLQKASAIAADYVSDDMAEPVLVKRATRDAAKARRLPAKTAATAPYYIFSRGEGQGFVIVSGDDCTQQVLGYTESGDFVEDQMPPQLLSWLESLGTRIEETQARGENVSRQSEARRANYTSTGVRKAAANRQTIEPLIYTHWHQSWPYNSWCPYIKGTTNRAATGCVATAGAQVIYYFHKDLPDYIMATTPTYDWGDAPVTQSVEKGRPMKWGIMLNDYNSAHPAEFDDAIGEFTLAVGAYTWMSYGASSGAYISNLVPTFNDCFDLSSQNQSFTSHAVLEPLAYASLVEKRPSVYAGYNSNNEGHAIVLDGYRASDDKFHFNFGWGGQGDGWYVMEDEGVNGFGINPSLTYNVRPKHLNVKTTVTTPQGFYTNHDNKVRVTLKNNSTFPLESIHLFLELDATTPTDVKKAKSTQVVNVPNDGSEMDIYLTAKPTAAKDYYITITDEKLNVLSREKFTATAVGNDLLFQSLMVLGTDEKETHSGHDFTIVNGKYITCQAKVLNRSDMSYQESPRIQVLCSEDDGATFTSIGAKSAYNINIGAHEIGDFWFTISPTSTMPIDYGKLYAVTLMKPLTIRSDTKLYYETTDTMAFFIIREAEGMTAELDGSVLKFDGLWSAYDFETLVNKRANVNANVYDLRNVKGISRVPVLSGKEHNMILVNGDVDVTGVNVINVDKAIADHLFFEVGSDFTCPLQTPIHAASVSLQLNITPNEWNLITVPCAMKVPDGIFAKRIDAYTATGISGQTTNVTELEAGKTYLLMTSSTKRQELTATDVDVVPSPAVNDCDAVRGTFQNYTIPLNAAFDESIFYLDNDYFRPLQFTEPTPADDEDPETYTFKAFTGYFASSTLTRAFRSISNVTLDNAYTSLGRAISDVYAIYDKYADYVTAEACEKLLAEIAKAEAYFTSRELEARDIIEYTKELREAAEVFQRQLDGESLVDEFDVSFLLVNPSFERGTTASSSKGSTYGWTVGTGARAYENSNINYRGVGADGKYLVYSKKNSSEDGMGISQTIATLPKGVYALTAMLGTEPDSTVTLFANDIEQEFEASPSGQFYLREARIDDIIIREGESLTVGIKDGHWYKADDFHLYFVRPLTADEDVYTAIGEVKKEEVNMKNEVIYDLQGRRIAADSRHSSLLSPGIYISGGKKVLVK